MPKKRKLPIGESAQQKQNTLKQMKVSKNWKILNMMWKSLCLLLNKSQKVIDITVKKMLFINEEKVYSQEYTNYIVYGKCLSSLNRGTPVPPFAYTNNLDPGDIPPELKHLNVMEKHLISKIHLYLTTVILPGGQFGEKGQSIHFPIQNI